MAHRLVAGSALVAALSVWHAATTTPSLALTAGATAGCPLSPAASAAWTGLGRTCPPPAPAP
ncbi:MAG: hypothetical protein E6J00_07330 [Chloroflexi bacterium]|nr:MAG: hypothetical protein E6J00_07330 [Chloroflexota bacterium]